MKCKHYKTCYFYVAEIQTPENNQKELNGSKSLCDTQCKSASQRVRLSEAQGAIPQSPDNDSQENLHSIYDGRIVCHQHLCDLHDISINEIRELINNQTPEKTDKRNKPVNNMDLRGSPDSQEIPNQEIDNLIKAYHLKLITAKGLLNGLNQLIGDTDGNAGI